MNGAMHDEIVDAMPPQGVPESKLVYVDDGATALVIAPFVSNEKTRHGRKRVPLCALKSVPLL